MEDDWWKYGPYTGMVHGDYINIIITFIVIVIINLSINQSSINHQSIIITYQP